MTVAVVGAALANKPGNAGAAWTRLSWLLGLARLGFDVHLVEELAPGDDGAGERWFASVTAAFDLAERSTLLRPDGTSAAGLSPAQLGDLASEAALLVNISGHLRRPELTRPPAVRVYVDLDPGYTQAWSDDGVLDLGAHDHWYSVGELVGTPWCPLPTGGRRWRPIRQPVVLDDWPVQPDPGTERFTTVGAWRGPFGTLEHGGHRAAGKVHEFRRFVDLPTAAPGVFELALDIHAADHQDRALLEGHGWHLADPQEVAGDPAAFRRYVQASSAEASVAQGVYVALSTGWFGDRSVRYLASGRPALLQDTGFSRTLPVGEGVVAFTTLEEAVAGARSILDDHGRHAAAARRLAEDHFASDIVLGRLCEEVGVAP